VEQEYINLHDEFTNGKIGRRVFLDRLTALAGSSAAAAALVPLLQNDYARAQMIPENDSRLNISRAEYEVDGVTMSGYLARPAGGGRHPAVIVIHEIYGLNPHIEDVTRRLAVEGFLAFGVDMLSALGGTPADSSEAGGMLRNIDADQHVERLVGAVGFLADHEESNGNVGVVGFCWGGGMANALAVAAGSALDAAVPYYGSQPPAEDVPKISAPLLLQYGANDERINAGIPAYEAALKANNKTYEIYIYEGAGHAFNNDTNASRYNKEAAELAWGRTIAFFKKYLSD